MSRQTGTFCRLMSACAITVSLVPAGCGQQAHSTEGSARPSDGTPAPTTSQMSDLQVESEPALAGSLANASTPTGNDKDAMRRAAEAGRYLFAFFWKTDDDATVAMRRVFDSATADFANRADCVAVRITEPEQKEVVEEFGLDRAPMPLVLAFAPNGAVTGGFPT